MSMWERERVSQLAEQHFPSMRFKESQLEIWLNQAERQDIAIELNDGGELAMWLNNILV